jgi:hypothetical protein
MARKEKKEGRSGRLVVYSNGAQVLDVAANNEGRKRARNLGARFMQTTEGGDEHWTMKE